MSEDSVCPWCGEADDDGACTCDLPGGELRLGAGFVKAHRVKATKGAARGTFTTKMVLVRRGTKGAPTFNGRALFRPNLA